MNASSLDSRQKANTVQGVGIGLMVLAGLFVVSRYNFLLFHGLAELFSVAVAWSLFFLVWNTRSFASNHAYLFIGIAYFFIGLIDLTHMLSYKGMGVFPNYLGANPATQLWIAARGLEAVSLLLFPLLIFRRIYFRTVFGIIAVITALAIWAIFSGHFFPDCYVEGQGLTAFKKIAEYVISLTLIGAIALLFRIRKQLDETVFRLMVGAMALTVVGELTFTFYVSVYGLSNVIGHFFKIVSFFLIYRALIRSSLTRPYETLFRGLEKEKTALKESESRFKMLYMDAPIAYQSLDAEGNFLDVNKRFCEVLGYAPEELIGTNFGDLLRSDGRDHFKEAFPRFKAVGEVLGVEFSLRKKNGEYILVSFNGRIGKDLDGEFLQTHCVFRDITKEREDQEALSKSEEYLRKVVAKTPQPLCIVNTATKGIKYYNETFIKTFGYTLDDVPTLEKWWSAAYPDLEYCAKVQQLWLPAVEEATITGIEISPQEWRMRRKDGKFRDVEFKFLPLGESSLISMTDLTPQKEMIASMLQAKETAEDANRAKSDFLANMSHELRTPLNGMLGMLQLMQTTSLNAEQKDYIFHAIQSSKRLTRLLSDILDLARVEANRMSLVCEPLEPCQVLRQLEELFQPLALKSGVSLTCQVHPDIPSQVLGDATRLQQVLGNLVGNAFRFTKSGCVTVEACSLPAPASTKCKVLFSVSDTGFGIPDDKLNSLFNPFTQVSQGYRRDHQGAGLGLSICKRLVGLMGGNMAVESKIDVGTTVYFPIVFDLLDPAQALASKVIPATVAEHAPILKGLRILLVEDERLNSFAAAKLLSKFGVEVEVVGDGQSALEALRQEHFDLVLMDIQMPVMDGVEATKAIRGGQAGKDKQSVPIIAMTAFAMAGDKENFLAAGMNGYLTKPIEIDTLRDTISETMKNIDKQA